MDLLSEAEGYRFSSFNKKGVVIYTYDEPIDTTSDHLAFGFMTRHQNGTIFRADSEISADYIEAKLVSSDFSDFLPFVSAYKTIVLIHRLREVVCAHRVAKIAVSVLWQH